MAKKRRASEISLDPGTIYFIGERDLVSGEETAYVKIGLTKLDRSPEDREDNLKTGNPRELFVKHQEYVPLVHSVERALRYEFRLQNVLLEWHVFRPDSPKKLSEAISVCQQLGKEFIEYVPVIEKAKSLGSSESIGDVKPKTPDAEHWWREYLIHSHVMNLEASAQKQFADLAKSAAAEGRPAPTGTTTRESTREVVDWVRFKNDHPDILAAFPKSTFKRDFDLKGKLSSSELQTPLVLDVQSRVDRFDELLKNPASEEPEYYSDLFRQYLMIQQIANFSSFRKEIARCQLSVLCGDAPGIQDLIVWKSSYTIKPDTKAIQNAHSQLVDEYTTKKVVDTTKIEAAGTIAGETEE